MKISREPLYLSAAEAAAELSISPATLYAYVSRGLVRSEPSLESRARRYRADDVRALKNRRAPPGMPRDGEIEATILETAVSTITAVGPVYRGVAAVRLAENASLEQAATLLWDASAVDPFAAGNLPSISAAMRAVAVATQDEPPVGRAIAMLALAGAADPRAFNRTADGRAQVGARVLRLTAAAILGTEPSAAPLHRQVAEAWVPEMPAAGDLLRRALVLLADHELNASTFTVRSAASTGLNLYDATIAGLVALKGPRHGGAATLAAHFVADLATGDAAGKIRDRVALGAPVPGFGHVVYTEGDPRADDLLAALARADPGNLLASEVPALISEATGLRPNIDFALAVTMRTLGLPIGHEMSLFAIARVAGWVAHAIEQLQSDRLMRPRARYVGPAPVETAGG